MLRHRTTILSALVLAAVATVPGTVAVASTPPVTGARVVAHFNFTAQQQPENIVVEPNGAADLTFSFARQVARVSPQGKVTILATLPSPVGTSGRPGKLGVSGIVRAPNGTLYVNYNGGTQSGIWAIGPHGGNPVRVVAMPNAGFLNGLTMDPATGTLFVADTVNRQVLQVSPRTGQTTVWASGLAANGVKLHNGSVWVSTLAAVTGPSGATGNLVRIPFRPDRTAGPVAVVANVPGMDDFTFTGSGDTVLAAQNPSSQVSLVRPDGTQQVVLTAADGLDNPTAVAMRGSTIYVSDSAFNNGTDPNLLVAHLQR